LIKDFFITRGAKVEEILKVSNQELERYCILCKIKEKQISQEKGAE
jgi:hypothetical protein